MYDCVCANDVKNSPDGNCELPRQLFPFIWSHTGGSRLSLGQNINFSQIGSREDRGHQSSGARAPRLWCPNLFWGGFRVIAQSYTLSMFCVVHKDRKWKFIFFKQIFEIKSKSFFRHGRAPVLWCQGVSGRKNGAPELWCPLMLNKIFCFYLKRGLRNENNIFSKYVHCPHVLHKTWFKTKGTRNLVPLIVLTGSR